MRVLLLLAGLSAWMLAFGVPAGAVRADRHFESHGISVTVPAGWWRSTSRMSSGVEPVFRLTLSDRALHRTARDSGPCYGGIAHEIQPGGVVAILREALGGDFKPANFQRRSRHLVLPRRTPGQDNSCLGDHATLVTFRQAGRGFYLWIAAGRRASPARIETLLRTLDAITIEART